MHLNRYCRAIPWVLFYKVWALSSCQGFIIPKLYLPSSTAGAISKLYTSSQNSNVDVEIDQIQLSTGIQAEIMKSKPEDDKTPLSSLQMVFNSKPKPPLIFIHGSFHASWCWAEKFFSFFTLLGYTCYAISLRGTGGTFAGEGVKRVKIMDHVDDLQSFIEYVINKEEGLAPVLISHSFGGLAVMKYLEKHLYDGKRGKAVASDVDNDFMPRFLSENVSQPLSGVCLLCSVPPSGNGKMTLRFLRRSFKDSWKITAGLAIRKCITDKSLCRDLFFGGPVISNDTVVENWGISEEDLERYQGNFKRDTVATINLRDLAKQLPSLNVDKQYGQALFVDKLPPALVVGATDDFIVDNAGVIETAKYFGVEPVMIDSPHDVMLGKKFENAAIEIKKWLETLAEK